jgi:hypothetical protein
MDYLVDDQYIQLIAEGKHNIEKANQDLSTFIQEKKKFCDKISSLKLSQTTAQIGPVSENDKAVQIDEIHVE